MTRKYIDDPASTVRVPYDILTLIAGAALFLSPLVFGFGDAGIAGWTAHVAGIAIIAVAVRLLLSPAEWGKWACIVLGLATFLAPWVLGFSGMAVASWTHIVLGLAVGGIGLWRLFVPTEPGTSGPIGPDPRST